MKKIGSTLAAVTIAFALVAIPAVPANAASYNAGSYSCPYFASDGRYIRSSSNTTGDTSHNVWSSMSDNQGKWWAGTSAWLRRDFYSTKRTASSVRFTFTSYTSLGKLCHG